MNARLKFVLTLFACMMPVPAFAGDWQPFGPFGGNVLVTASDPRRPGVVLAGARNGLLFRSDDGAKTWRRLTLGRSVAGAVQALAIDPSDSSHYFAGLASDEPLTAGLWESFDAGEHWRITPGLTGLAIESLAMYRKDAKILAVGTRRGIYGTRDGGKNWLRISPTANPELQDITALAFDPVNPAIVYAGTPHLPWKTTDGGASWRSIRTGMLDDSDVFSVFVDPAHPQRVFSSACSGIYSSQNGGTAWKLLDGIPGTSRRTHIIVQDPRRPQVMYAGTTAGLFKSWNGGARWNHLNSLQINSIAFDAADSRTLYLATERGGMVVTRDGGETLGPMNEGLASRNVGSAATAGGLTFLSTIYEGAEGGVFATGGGSGQWRRIGDSSTFGGRNVRALATGDGKTVFAGAGDRLYRSMDSGGNWAEVPGLGHEIRALQFIQDGALLIGTSAGLFRLPKAVAAEPSQLKVKEIAVPVEAIYTSPHGEVLVKTESGLLVSNKNGSDWKKLALADGTPVGDAAFSCAGQALIAPSQGVLRLSSTNANAPESVHGIPGGTVSALTFHPTRCEEAYAVQFGVLYVSRDGGATWTVLPGVSAQSGSVDKMWIDAFAPAQLFGIFRGQGVFVRSLD